MTLATIDRLPAPPADGVPAWLASRRAAAVKRFGELGFPTTRQEAWRFTDVSRIAEAAFAVEMMASPGDVALTIHTHPTLGEGVMEAFKHALGEAVHIMNRRTAPRPELAAA